MSQAPVLASAERTRIVSMENHDGAFWAWKEAGFKNRTLLHFDAHIDFTWIAPSAEELLEASSLAELEEKLARHPLWHFDTLEAEQRINLGNYLNEALRTGVIGRLIWVYPDAEPAALQSEAVAKILDALARLNPREMKIQALDEGIFEGTIFGRSFTALPFRLLERAAPSKDALVNIDTDFMIVRSLSSKFYPFARLPGARPWLSPEALLAAISRTGTKPEMVTLAFSVEEGYTPLRLKFLGQELKARLEGENNLSAYGVLHEALSGQDIPRPALVEKLKALPNPDAAVYFELAHQLHVSGLLPEARRYYQLAVSSDDTYATEYSHDGPALNNLGLDEAARRAFERRIELAPEDPFTRFFQGEELLRRRQWRKAASLFETIRATGRFPSRLPLRLAESYLHLDRCEDALVLLKNYPRSGILSDVWDIECWRLQAQAEKMAGNSHAATAALETLSSYLISDNGLHLAIHASLAFTYARRSKNAKALRHLKKLAHRIFMRPFERPKLRKPEWKLRRTVSNPRDDRARFRKTPSLRVTRIGEHVVILDVNERRVVKLSGLGADLWPLLDQGQTVGEIVSHMQELYDAPPGQIQQDTRNFIASLAQCEIVESHD